jgi:hypothetical protein
MTQPESQDNARAHGSHAPIHRDQAIWERGNSAGAALEVVLDTGNYGGRLFVEVHCVSNSPTTFDVEGSVDGTTWRKSSELQVTGSGEVHGGFFNAYQFIRVATAAVGNHEVEIVATR